MSRVATLYAGLCGQMGFILEVAAMQFYTRLAILAAACLLSAPVCHAKILDFAGYTWTVHANGTSPPGPNNWSEDNAWVDDSGQLHLTIRKVNGRWYAAEVFSMENFGFGRYLWFVTGAVDKLDKNVVLGLFNYRGQNKLNEIDIEMAKWGDPSGKAGNFTVYPARSGLSQSSMAFSFRLSGEYTTHKFDWQSQSVHFQLINGHRSDNHEQLEEWTFAPSNYLNYIPQLSMPLHINLWLFKGEPPSDGNDVEVIIKGFTYTK